MVPEGGAKQRIPAGWAALRVCVAGLAAVALACRGGVARRQTTVTVAAASSLRNVIPELVRAFPRSPGGPSLSVTYGASGVLRRQVDAGAPIDMVILAAPEPVDALIQDGAALAASRRVIAYNGIVLIGAPGEKRTFHTLAAMAGNERLAIGDPRTVPAGRYAREALQKLGAWDILAERLVLGGNVAAVLAYARRREVEAGIVYRTDVKDLDDVVVLDQARGAWAPRVEVVAALTRGQANTRQTASAFLEFLTSRPAWKILHEAGFEVPGS